MGERSVQFAENKRADRGSRVLVVEDVPVTREFLRVLLQDGGYQPILAATAAEGIAALERSLPDLLVLDLLLPDQNGLEVCRFLRDLPGGDDIPVLVITVDERPESHSEAVRAGVDDFLRKPLLPTELRTRVRSLIRLRQLRTELRRDRDAILSLQARKDELVQFVVHDLKNMTTALLACVDLMEMDGSEAQCERQRKRIGETTRGMVRMVQNMLDLSINEQAGLQPQPELIELEAWLQPVKLELESLYQRRNQNLAIHLEPGLEVEADPQLLERVILNLVENASKYGPEGGTIHLAARREGPTLRLSVAEEGESIPTDMRERVFDRFVRVEGELSGKPGRGLGLAFCRLVAELHGGRIWLEDMRPRGNRFVLKIPLKARTLLGNPGADLPGQLG
jgi:signal transduction histidine kinase